MATELRWDFEKIGNTDWADVTNLLNYWNKTPPVARLLHLYFRAKGLKIIDPNDGPTDAERRFVDGASKADTSQLPHHLKLMMKDIADGKLKYARNSG
jgi:hypothetical protein